MNTAGSKDALLRCADRWGMLWRTRPWTPLPTREVMGGRLENAATPASMNTDRPCIARSVGTFLSSLKMRTSPALAIQCLYQAGRRGLENGLQSGAMPASKPKDRPRSARTLVTRSLPRRRAWRQPQQAFPLTISLARRRPQALSAGPICRQSLSQSFGPAGRAFGKSSRRSS